MEGIELLLEQAWSVVGPKLKDDRAELERRWARRRSLIFQGAPRAWCLALRASDTRLNPMTFSRTAEGFWEGKSWRRPHEIYLDAREVRRLCMPVNIPKPGVSIREAAAMLGMGHSVISAAMRRGIFRADKCRGVRGRPETRIYTPKLLDPGCLDRPLEDPGWCTAWMYLASHVPDDLRAQLLRRPSQAFRGNFSGKWMWECPGCRREVEILFCPLRWPRLVRFVNWAQRGGLNDVPEPVATFACHRCHRILGNERCGRRGWNDLVTFLSGGLLYGREVKRPLWWGKIRRRAFQRREKARRSEIRPQIERLLVETPLSFKSIALKLKLPLSTVNGWASAIYRDYTVHTRQELRIKASHSYQLASHPPALHTGVA